MYEIQGTSIKLTRGDSFYCTVGMTRNDAPYIPEEGDEVRFALKRKKMNALRTDFADSRPLIKKVIPNDTLLLHLAPSDTKDLGFGEYVYDIEITFASGDVDTFIKEASFTLTPEVD